MIKRVIGRAVFGVWLGCFAAGAVQLPPEIQVDRYLLRAERLMDAKDPEGALEVMGKIVALQKEHGLTLPDEFHFKHAKVALSAGLVQDAIDAVNQYLLGAGREGEFYREALELLEEAEQLQTWFDAEQTCAGKSHGASCWMELTGEAGCYVWNDYFVGSDETMTWTGECSGGRAQGKGTLKSIWEGVREREKLTGSLKDGKRHGRWVERNDIWVEEGPYMEGKRHGHWVSVSASDGSVAEEGPYVEGKRHGQWVRHFPSGVFGSRPAGVLEDSYVEGKRHGLSVIRFANGAVWEGAFVDYKMHGQWVEREEDGTVEYVTYEDGKEVRRSSRRQSQPRSGRAGGGRC